MRLHVLSVANRAPAWVEQGVAEYQKRMRAWPLHFTDIPIASRKQFANDTDKLKADEATRLRSQLPKNAQLVALDVLGKALSTEQLAGKLQDQAFSGGDVVFLIGGPDGLDASLIAECDWRWSLSALTFPHPLVKVILAEQLYRAWSVTANHPYHRGE